MELKDKVLKKQVVEKCWSYINDNFHKFTDANKLKVALGIVRRDMPTQLEGEALQTKVVIVRGDSGERNKDRPSRISRHISL